MLWRHMTLTGVEPALPFENPPLKRARLPFRHKAVVEETGFEPATSASRTQRSSRLSYSSMEQAAGLEPATSSLEG